jgi:polysaccharide deacetylase family protein (PEP-CTERM system associated)
MRVTFPNPSADARPKGPIVNGLSVDVEDWFQVGAFEDVIERDEWSTLADRVDRNVNEILDLFDEVDAKATFFTLGWVAQRHGALLREIVARGHEIASHGWDHRRVFTMDRASFAEDIAKARKAIEDASGARLTGYRAPSFSIDQRTPWAFMELVEQGYAYSSSVAPGRPRHYGWPEAPRFAFKPLPWASAGRDSGHHRDVRRQAAAPRVAAVSFRVLPYAFSRWAIRQVNRRDERRRSSTSIRGRSIPASRASAARRSSRAAGITPTSTRWRPSCAS